MDTVKLRIFVPDISPIIKNSIPCEYKNYRGGWEPNTQWIITTPKNSDQGYFPRIDIMKWFHTPERPYAISVQLSVPKMLYGNNLIEVDEADLERITTLIADKVTAITTIRISPDDIANAEVARIDYSKNIISHSAGFTRNVIDLMAKQNITKRFDLTTTDYSRDGHGMKYHCKSYEFAIYDKRVDLQKEGLGRTRMLSAETTDNRKELMRFIDKSGLHVLRIEARFIGSRSIKCMLSKYSGIPCARSPTFAKLFNMELAQTVVVAKWEEYTKDADLLALDVDMPYEIWVNQLMNGSTMIRSLAASGLQQIVRQVGTRKVRAVVDEFGKSNSWRSLERLLDNLPRSRTGSILEVDKALERFEIIKSVNNY